jgi:hypothetical protein
MGLISARTIHINQILVFVVNQEHIHILDTASIELGDVQDHSRVIIYGVVGSNGHFDELNRGKYLNGFGYVIMNGPA